MSRRVHALHKPPLLGYYTMVRGGSVTPPFSPTDITGLKLWIDFSDADTLFTDAGSTPVSSDGDAIYQANDKSGNGFHAVMATEADRPAYKTNVQNGKSVSRYNQDVMVASFGGLVLNQPNTIFFVHKNTVACVPYSIRTIAFCMLITVKFLLVQ